MIYPNMPLMPAEGVCNSEYTGTDGRSTTRKIANVYAAVTTLG